MNMLTMTEAFASEDNKVTVPPAPAPAARVTIVPMVPRTKVLATLGHLGRTEFLRNSRRAKAAPGGPAFTAKARRLA